MRDHTLTVVWGVCSPPKGTVVSLYIDQIGPLDSATAGFAALDDLGLGFAEKYGVRICGSIAEALCLGGDTVAVRQPAYTLTPSQRAGTFAAHINSAETLAPPTLTSTVRSMEFSPLGSMVTTQSTTRVSTAMTPPHTPYFECSMPSLPRKNVSADGLADAVHFVETCSP